MRKLRQFFSHEGRSQWLLALETDSPQASLIFANIAAGLGIIIFTLFPLMTLIGALKVIGIATSAASVAAWLHAFIWLLLTTAFATVTYTQFRVRVSTPSGLGLKDDKAPRLYELLNELVENYKSPPIHRIVIHDKFSLELVRVPRFGLPLLTTNVLYIGLPILQGLSPAQFRGALGGVLGQSSSTQNKKTHWIYRWHQFCSQYQHAGRKYSSAIFRPLQWFFRVYTPFLKYWAAAALRQDELEADIYMLDIINDTDVADIILRYEVCQAFLKNKYWPKIYAMLRKNPAGADHLPHINMAKVLRNTLSENEFAQTVKDLINREPAWSDTKPVLHTRLNNIGQTKLNMPPPVMETAAQRYLGDAFGAVIKLLDKQWLAKQGKSRGASSPKKTPAKAEAITDPSLHPEPPTLPQTAPAPRLETTATPKTQAPSTITSDEAVTIATVADGKRLAELKHKATSGKLNDNEAWQLAYLTEKLEDKSHAIALYQQVLRQNPNHAKTLFAVGRIMLTRMDETGVKVLERAMELDNGCIAQGCWMLAKYYKAIGDEARSRQFLERAAKIAA